MTDTKRKLNRYSYAGDKNPNWNGGYKYNKKLGNIFLYKPGYVSSNKDHYVLEHVYVAEKALGKQLPPKAIVHHINGIRTDNKGCNLVICQDQSYHMLIHKRMRALKECGNANWLKCKFCHMYDDPKNLTTYGRASHHTKCLSEYRKDCRAC